MTINNGEQVIDLAKALGAMAKEADMVCVVRCKDCKWWMDDHTCREHSLVSPMGANEFCSRGERGDADDE